MSFSTSSPASPLSTETLQHLLSFDAAQRKAAEEQLQATNLTDRIDVFVQTLTTTTTTTATTTTEQDGSLFTVDSAGGALLHMVAVLLRRDILKLSADRDSVLLQNLVRPLLEAFGNVPSSTKVAVGNCLAEICFVFETTTTTTTTTTSRKISGSSTTAAAHDGQISDAIISQILAPVATSASEGHLPSLQLLVALSERAPRSFAQVALPSLPQLIQSLVKHPVFYAESEEEMDPNWPDKRRLYIVATELVTTTAIALGRNAEPATAAGSDVESPIAAETRHSPVTGQLGTKAFRRILSIENVFSDVNVIAKIMPLWMQAAHLAPDLFIGSDQAVWERTVLVCLQISAQEQEPKLAIQAMQVLNHLVSHLKNRLAGSMRQNLMQSVIPRLINILRSEVDSDVEAWAVEPVTSSVVDKDTFSDDDGEAGYAYEQLQAWICVSPALALSIALPLLERHLEMDWANQWAAVVCIQACAEEAPLTFLNHVTTALQASLQLASTSANVRVQYQSIQLVGILCETVNPVVWDLFAERILRVLATALGSYSDRVRTMSCKSLVSYCRPSAEETLDEDRFVTPYLHDLINALCQGPLTGPTVVQSRALQAIICLAHVSGAAFAQYYSQVMPALLNLARQAKSHDYEDCKLQGSAIEAATILGQSLGEENKHMFAPDATMMMQWIVPVLQQDPNDINSFIPMGQLLSACARIASVAGEAYAEYARVVMPHLLHRIQAPTDIEISEGDVSDFDGNRNNDIEVDEETGQESLTVVVPGHGLKKLTISTSKIEEKAEAIRGIYEHAVALEGVFYPFAQSCFDTLLPLLGFRYAADVRATTAQSLAAVFEAACCYGDQTGDFLLCSVYLPKLALNLARQAAVENEMEALYAIADATSEILFCVFSRRQSQSQLLLAHFPLSGAKTFVKHVMSSLVPCLERRAKVANILANAEDLSGEDEKASYQKILDGEEKLLTPFVDSVGYTLKLFGESFYSVFQEHVVPVLRPFLVEGPDVRARLAAVCLFDDCVEFCGTRAQMEVGPALVKGVLLGLNDATNGQDEELKQACVYGIIQLSRSASAEYLVAHAQFIVDAILSIAREDKTEAASLPLFENCISAIAALFLMGRAPFRASGLIKMESAIGLFVKNLPLSEDYDEAKKCHAGFCDLIRAGQVDVQTDCATIVRVAGDILSLVQTGEDIATEETCTNLAEIMIGLQSSPVSTMFDSALATLPDTSKSAIQVALQSGKSG